MSVAVLMVKMKIPKEIEAKFNAFYEQVHIPDVLAFPGAVSFRRYRAVMGDDGFQLLSVVEFKDEAALRRFFESDYRKQIAEKLDAEFGGLIERQRLTYEQTWP